MDFANIGLKEFMLSAIELLESFTLLQLRLIFTQLYFDVALCGWHISWKTLYTSAISIYSSLVGHYIKCLTENATKFFSANSTGHANFSREIWHKISHTSYPFTLYKSGKFHYVYQQNWQRPEVWTLFEYTKMFWMSSITLQILCQTISKTRDIFVNRTCGKLSNIFWCDF